MDKKEEVIQNFIAERPAAVGVYGYGSGVFKQEGYKDKDKPQIDLIFLVDNLKEWHLANMHKNSSDYSLMGKLFINYSGIEKLKGHNGITYLSHIKEDGYCFKYGVMEEKDFIRSLRHWQNFFVVGRFHNPTLEIKGNARQRKVIEKNRKSGMLVAALLAPSLITKTDFYQVLCGLSYRGTLRMSIAENPHKVQNIVNGNFERFNEMYGFDVDYITELPDGTLEINHNMALKHVKELPRGLLVFLYFNGYLDLHDINKMREGIDVYLTYHNKKEELAQSLEGIQTNGMVKSMRYFSAKVDKRIRGK